jgi:hypothetical protein
VEKEEDGEVCGEEVVIGCVSMRGCGEMKGVRNMIMMSSLGIHMRDGTRGICR